MSEVQEQVENLVNKILDTNNNGGKVETKKNGLNIDIKISVSPEYTPKEFEKAIDAGEVDTIKGNHQELKERLLQSGIKFRIDDIKENEATIIKFSVPDEIESLISLQQKLAEGVAKRLFKDIEEATSGFSGPAKEKFIGNVQEKVKGLGIDLSGSKRNL